MATYHDARSARPHHDASSSASAGSSYLPPPRQTDLGGHPDSTNYPPPPSNVGPSGSGGYPSGPPHFNNYPSSHSQQQQRLPHLPPPPLQHQSSYSSHSSHPPPHSTHPPVYHHQHPQRQPPPPPPPPQSSSSAPYNNYDYSQPLPVFPHNSYSSFGLNVDSRGQGAGNDVNGSGGGGQPSRHGHHASTSSSGRSDDFKQSYPFFGGPSSNAPGQSNPNGGGGAQRNGVQDDSNPVMVAPLPEHIEANIMAGSTSWLFGPPGFGQGSEPSGGGGAGAGAGAGAGIAESVAGAEPSQPSAPSQSTASPPVPPQAIPQSLSSAQNNADPSPVNPHPTLPDTSEFALLSSTIYDPLPMRLPAQMAPPSDPLLLGPLQDGWRLAVEPNTFLSGLEGISVLPLNQFHTTVTSTSEIPPPLMNFERRPNGSYDAEVEVLAEYLANLIDLIEPFTATRENPNPNHPPPFLHTRVNRIAVIVRECIKNLEMRSQPCLDPSFRLLPPGIEQSEAEKEMTAIQERRKDLLKKQIDKGKNNGMTSSGGGNRLPPPRPVPSMGPGGPRPFIHARPRDVSRCSGCNTTQSLEWLSGPDGPQSLCHACGHQYEILNHTRQGDPDFSSIPIPGHNSNLIGLGPG